MLDDNVCNAVAEHVVDDDVADVELAAIRIRQVLVVLVEERLHDRGVGKEHNGPSNGRGRRMSTRTGTGAGAGDTAVHI